MKIYLLFYLLIFPFGCSKNLEKLDSRYCLNFNKPCLNGKVIVQIQTNKGKIFVELDGESAPLTAGNFLDLINKGNYNQTIFHRVIKSPKPFIVQGGDPISKNPSFPNEKYGLGNYIDPSTGKTRLIPLEIKLSNEKEPRYNQLITKTSQINKINLSHKRGTIAMARSQSLNSSSSQFYITLRNLPELDGRYSAFGRVIKGMSIVDQIEQGDKIIKALLLK